MVSRERPDDSRGATERGFARFWRSPPKIVFSSRLDAVEGSARLAAGGPPEELARLEGDIAVGGAGLAATLIERGLIDGFRVFVNRVIVGGGTERPSSPPWTTGSTSSWSRGGRSAHA